MPQQHNKKILASAPTTLVYEEEDYFAQYAGASRFPVAVYDRERAVLEAARARGRAINADSVRVVFIVQVKGTKQPPTPPLVNYAACK